MSLHCLALLGSMNEPLYLCSPPDDDNNNDVGEADLLVEQNNNKNSNDVFGFADDLAETKYRKTRKPPMRLEMMMHASLDRLEELLGSPRKANTYGKFKRGSHWLGSICPMDDVYEIYGYVTSSDVKILALIEREGVIPLKKRKEIDIKIFFTAVHDCYVKHTMNPFSNIRGKIEPPCDEFETGILAAMQQYNDAVGGGEGSSTQLYTI